MRAQSDGPSAVAVVADAPFGVFGLAPAHMTRSTVLKCAWHGDTLNAVTLGHVGRAGRRRTDVAVTTRIVPPPHRVDVSAEAIRALADLIHESEFRPRSLVGLSAAAREQRLSDARHTSIARAERAELRTASIPVDEGTSPFVVAAESGERWAAAGSVGEAVVLVQAVGLAESTLRLSVIDDPERYFAA